MVFMIVSFIFFKNIKYSYLHLVSDNFQYPVFAGLIL